ncbi:Annexin [Penicillium concentricum]|uniref:Annexin n=1 Tax=Penicillium concentricum TaxID=293559 RepID=A0A9W9S6R2_9EURO|nr:Annexin [Penicillium concentricum]KAJ5372647.1 Annexin [Penicillium concentricum]
MSLQVNDPRSRTRSKSPGRERSRSRDSRAPSPSHRSRSPAVEAPRTKGYSPDEEADIERQYKLISEERRRENDEPRASRAPRSPRYDVNRSDSDSESRRRDAERSRRYDDRYEHSDSERGSAAAPSSRSHRRRPSPDRGSRVNHDSDSADDLAYGDVPGSHPSYARPNRYSYAQPTQFAAAAPRPGYPAAPIDWASVPECERPGYVPPSSQPAGSATMPGAFPVASTYSATSGSVPAPVIPSQYPGFPGQAYATSAGYAPAHYRTASATDTGYPAAGYANPGAYQYAQVDPNVVKYASKAEPKQAPVYPASTNEHYSRPLPQQLQNQYYPQSQQKPPPPQQQQQQAPDQSHRYRPEPEFVEIAPGGNRSSTRPHSQSVSSNTLAVAGASAAHSALPPGSPLLEPYRGTYQSISPMPSPIVIPSIRDDDISDLEPLDGSDSSRRSKHHRSHSSVSEKDARTRSSKDKKDKERDDRTDKRLTRPTHDRHDSNSSIPDGKILVSPTTGRKRVSFYDAGPDAAAMQSALNHARNIDSKPIIQILPRLSSDEIILLRAEYKSRVRMQGKGINIAKHLRLKLGSSSFGKVCYATALGRWESEAYWANCYYQAGTSRRELLIESLMGRSNAAIREIKNSFRDTRYDNSIERCMRSELRADKFRVAILLALEGQRQDDREPLDKRLVRDDVQDLHRAIVREGGETLAHILNGAINRPMRDALLLHQALRESRTGRERSELLISRLVRLHWEPRHLDLVKNEYRRRYHERLEEAIAEEILSLNGGQDWGEFCIELARNA